MSKAVKVFNYSRQYYYFEQHKMKLQYDMEDIVTSMVSYIRNKKHLYGMDKTYYYLKRVFKQAGLKIGRDKFREIMRKYNLKIKVKRKRKLPPPIGLKDAENKMFNIKLERVNQVWFTDITYIKTKKDGTIRLALVMDGNSRYILSYALDDNTPSLALRALQKAMELTKPEIHHSDRGIDYINDNYTNYLKEHGVKLSFSRAGVPQDNGIMERTIGTLKNEMGLKTCKTIGELREKLKEVISFYNNLRPHQSCGYRTPSSIYYKTELCTI